MIGPYILDTSKIGDTDRDADGVLKLCLTCAEYMPSAAIDMPALRWDFCRQSKRECAAGGFMCRLAAL